MQNSYTIRGILTSYLRTRIIFTLIQWQQEVFLKLTIVICNSLNLEICDH